MINTKLCATKYIYVATVKVAANLSNLNYLLHCLLSDVKDAATIPYNHNQIFCVSLTTIIDCVA